MRHGRLLPLGAVEHDALGSAFAAHERSGAAAIPDLSPRETAQLEQMLRPSRRDEWVAGRAVAKAVLHEMFALAPRRVEVLPSASGAPEVHVDGARHAELHLSISHTRLYAVAAVARAPVGIDACDDDDGRRLHAIARRVFGDGEAEACGAHASPASQAAVWALKEAGLKLRGGGVLHPGARSVRVEALDPACVADPSMCVELFRLPRAAVAVARTRELSPRGKRIMSGLTSIS